METESIHSSIQTQNGSFSEMNTISRTEFEDGCYCECKCVEGIDEFNKKFENYGDQIESRLNTLNDMLKDLKTEFTKETEMWKNELNESEKVPALIAETKSDYNVYACRSDHESVMNGSETIISNTLTDYEQKLQLYQDRLMRAQAERRLHLRRHLAAHAYRQKLLEVENMCNLELLKVKQSVQVLQPLQAIVSEWNFDYQENFDNFDDELTGGRIRKDFDDKSDTNSLLTLGSEYYGNKTNLEIKEIKEITPRLSSTASYTASSVLPDEDDNSTISQRINIDWLYDRK